MSLPYTVDVQDIRFVLFDQLKVDTHLATVAKYADFDKDLYDTMIDEAEKLAVEVLAPLNTSSDREGCKLDDAGNVTTPTGYKDAWNLIAEGGWVTVTAPPEVGGIGLPSTIGMAVTEMFIGASMAFWMYPGLTAAAARVLLQHGAETHGKGWAEKLFIGEWGGTMCLTEAGAGSDVGENRCKATPIEGEPDTYHLEGEKIFISSGDQDLTTNIVHLVLARTPDSQAGTKGLSLFAVPKFLVNDDGSLGERNDAFVVGIEEKMGIHGSATCTLALGSKGGKCRSWLVGEEHHGIQIMFLMMNEARIGVGAQGVAVAATAYQYALHYAKERLQGSSLKNMRDAEAPRVAITAHPDVRRMLMTMKVQAEACRSLLYRLGVRHDIAENNPEKHEQLMGRVELLTPVLKAHCTDIGFENAVLGVQVMGGYGYIGEYPMEQLVRDAKIMSIYEGTNGIQALDLVGRKMRMKGGALFMEWMQDANTEVSKGGDAGFTDEAAAIGKAIQALGAAAMHIAGVGGTGNVDGAMLQATPFLRMFGVVQLALECLQQARVAKGLIDQGNTSSHLAGKALNLKFYVSNLLPQAVGLGKTIRSGDESCLDAVLFA
jgi:hypothetical protein